MLENKVCLVTGSSKGIGKQIAETFAKNKGVVYANAREMGSIDEWAEECSENYNTQVIPLYFDVTNTDDCKEAILKIRKEQKRIDILVNNAGLVSYELLAMTDINMLKKMLDVNVVAVVQLMQLVTRLMARQKSGSIINISSIVGVKGVQGQLSYSATKGAINALTKSAAKELASNNIRVNAIAPGMVGTERFKKVFEEKFSERINDIGMNRLAEPKEIADACLFLASDMSKYISGQIIAVDGVTNF